MGTKPCVRICVYMYFIYIYILPRAPLSAHGCYPLIGVIKLKCRAGNWKRRRTGNNCAPSSSTGLNMCSYAQCRVYLMRRRLFFFFFPFLIFFFGAWTAHLRSRSLVLQSSRTVLQSGLGVTADMTRGDSTLHRDWLIWTTARTSRGTGLPNKGAGHV